MTVTYAWTDSFHNRGVPAAAADFALTNIERQHGELKPEHVIAAAKHPEHIFHPFFEWDDARAAHAHRLIQARHLIASLRVVVRETGETLPARVSLRLASSDTGDEPTRAYRNMEKAVIREERTLSVWLLSELDHIARDLSRTASRPEMEPIRRAVDVVRAELLESQQEPIALAAD